MSFTESFLCVGHHAHDALCVLGNEDSVPGGEVEWFAQGHTDNGAEDGSLWFDFFFLNGLLYCICSLSC